MIVTCTIEIEGSNAREAAWWLMEHATGSVVDHVIRGFPENSFVLSRVRILSASSRLAELRLDFDLVDPFGNAHLERRDKLFPGEQRGNELIEVRPRINFQESFPVLADFIHHHIEGEET